MKNLLLLAALPLVTSCAVFRPLLIGHDSKQLYCPPSVMEPCDPLYYPTEGVDIGDLASKWGNQYNICQFKQKVLIECINNYEKGDGK